MNNLSRLTLLSLSVSSALFGGATVQAASYIPIVDKAVYITKTNMTCTLYDSNDYTNTTDRCNAAASIDVRVNISQMRSVTGVTPQGAATQNKKC